jgi:hypothetical protein
MASRPTNSKATRAQVMAAAAKIGAEVQDFGDYDHHIDVWAPTGFVWANHAEHGIYVDMPEQISKAFAWGEALVEIRQGVVPCTATDCEVCE